jgi:uncharacterized protein YbjT (DUF2867 family)
VEVVSGDFDRADTLDAAMRGVDTAVVTPSVPAQEIVTGICLPLARKVNEQAGALPDRRKGPGVVSGGAAAIASWRNI